uniref:Zgc:85932 n=1 Tax=Sinocyclocheilus anshuiensis TaxID=1608454 RepID=A0A671MCP8_9TELE
MSETKKQPSIDSSGSNPWESLGSPTLLWSPTSGLPLQDGLYTDTKFPEQDMLIQKDLVWKRPKEICPFPQFIADGATRIDICQGILHDCWFLSAVASLSLYPSLLYRVVPSGQGFQKGYIGRFSFRFWQYGEWTEVDIDDRLPTQNGQLIYLYSSNKNEFWSALLEKAYAKLKGGYTALNMGFPHEAMADMTGGVTEVFTVPSDPRILGSFLHPLLQEGALINCGNTRGAIEESNEFGIVFWHAYSVTGLETIKTTIGLVQKCLARRVCECVCCLMMCFRIEWNMVSTEEQQRVQRIQQVCHLSEDTLSESGVKKPWKCTLHHGCWIPQQGSPQYSLTLLEEDDDPSDPKLTCSFLLALMQKHTRKRGVLSDIALQIYKVSHVCFLSHATAKDQRRELVLRGRLAPGHYIIIPCAETNKEEEFLLRVLTEKPMSPRLAGLPSGNEARELCVKHCVKGPYCSPLDLYNLLTEAIAKGVFAGSEKQLSLEHCKSFAVLMDSQGMGRLNLIEFQALWAKLRKWTVRTFGCLQYFNLVCSGLGIRVDEFILQLIGLRYTEPDMNVSFPGFLFLLTKLDCIRKFQAFDATGMGVISVNCRQVKT